MSRGLRRRGEGVASAGAAALLLFDAGAWLSKGLNPGKRLNARMYLRISTYVY